MRSSIEGLALATERRSRQAAWGALAGLLIAATIQGPIATAHAQAKQDVKVERVRPAKPREITLRFLKENRDFLRGRFDLLRERPQTRHADGAAIDPRFLAYGHMVSGILAVEDSVTRLEAERSRREYLASVTELGRVESELDLMDQALADQRARLARLDEDFRGHQRTALMVVVSGSPATPVSSLTITIEGRAPLSISLTPEQRGALARGGIVQVFHEFVEPREQAVEVSLDGNGWRGDPGFVTLEPQRDRLTFLRLDLSAARPDLGASSLRATTWLHETKPGPGPG